MAMDKVFEFLSRLQTDDELATKADDAFVSGLHVVAGSAGYGFSEDELRAGMDAAAQRPLPESLEDLEELSDAELDNVVGAGSSFDTVFAGISSMGMTTDTVFAGSSVTVDGVSLRFSSFSSLGYTRR